MLHHFQKRYFLPATVLMLAVTTALPATAQITTPFSSEVV